MLELLEKNHICRTVARNFPELKEILIQIQLDIATEANRDTVGPTILALKNIYDIFGLFKAKGAVIVAQEAREDAKRNQTT